MDMMEEELQQAEADYMDYSNYLKEYVLTILILSLVSSDYIFIYLDFLQKNQKIWTL